MNNIDVAEKPSNKENELVLIRGVPGSGKSTIAHSMVNHKHFEADMFFIKDGQYKYDPKFIKEAHSLCIQKTLDALMKGKSVVVSNTFTRIHEMEPYFKMAYPIRIIEASGVWKNIHDVPIATVEKMKVRWERLPTKFTKKLSSSYQYLPAPHQQPV